MWLAAAKTRMRLFGRAEREWCVFDREIIDFFAVFSAAGVENETGHPVDGAGK